MTRRADHRDYARFRHFYENLPHPSKREDDDLFGEWAFVANDGLVYFAPDPERSYVEIIVWGRLLPAPTDEALTVLADGLDEIVTEVAASRWLAGGKFDAPGDPDVIIGGERQLQRNSRIVAEAQRAWLPEVEILLEEGTHYYRAQAPVGLIIQRAREELVRRQRG